MAGSEKLQDDVVEAISDESESVLPDLLGRIMDLYLLSEGDQSDSDVESFGFLLEQMAFAAGTEKRAQLANRLAQSSRAPLHLMRRLAFDEINVARPVLQFSQCLSERDLTTLASKLDQDYLLAIAHRLRLSPKVTEVLVDRGDSKVLVTAARNFGAEFSAKSLARLGDLAEADEELRAALDERPDLSPGMLKRLRSFIVDQFLAELVRDEPEETAGDETRENAEGDPAGDDAANDAEEMTKSIGAAEEAVEESGEKSPPGPKDEEDSAYDPVRDSYASERNLSKLARAGMLSESISCMVKLTGMDSTMVKHCLLTAELSALMVLCKANGLSNATFSTLLKLRESHSEEGGVIDVPAMLQRYDAMQTHTAKRIIQYAKKKRN
jgi:uncharacterized protein (DUF2336 family)